MPPPALDFLAAFSGQLDLAAGAAATEPRPAFVPCEFRIKWATRGWEQQQALALRHTVFCGEQGLFAGDDIDRIDDNAQTLVALSVVGGMPDQVVGTVRIHQAEPGLWWGSRLAVDMAFRNQGHIGATLIRLAVSSAHARGCRIFLAHVQSQNLLLFQRLNWQSLKEEVLHGRPHHLMQADLAAYPPCLDVFTGFVTRGQARSPRAVPQVKESKEIAG